jgi:hypothetical protein
MIMKTPRKNSISITCTPNVPSLKRTSHIIEKNSSPA